MERNSKNGLYQEILNIDLLKNMIVIIEKTTYQFSNVDKNLLLQTDKETERDGSFSNGNSYSYGSPGKFTPIKLPGE